MSHRAARTAPRPPGDRRSAGPGTTRQSAPDAPCVRAPHRPGRRTTAAGRALGAGRAALRRAAGRPGPSPLRPRYGEAAGTARPAAAPRLRPAGHRPGRVLFPAAALTVAAADQASKALAVATLSGGPGPWAELGPFRVGLVRNTGMAFGLGDGWPVLISLLTLAATGATLVTLGMGLRVRRRGWAVVLGLVAGGAVGNGADRLVRDPGPLRGGVVDWLMVSGHGPVFNLADVALALSALLTALLLLRGTVRAPAGP